MDTAALAVFREVARLGSFTAAAKTLRYTQSAVSRQVAALEADLGIELFERLPRGVRPTPAGQALLGHAEAVLDRLAAARRELEAIGGLGAGGLRIGAFPSAVVSLVPQAMARLRAEHPALELTLTEGLTSGLVTAVAAGDLDVAVVSSPGKPPGVRLVKLMDDPVLVALPAGHRLAGRKTVRLAELAGEDWIAGRRSAQDTLIALGSDSLPPIRHLVAEWSAKQGMVAAGLGVTVIPSLAVRGTRSDLALVALHPQQPRPVYVATAKTPSPAVQAFSDVLGQVAAQPR
ncbi:LysR family transcriptional regulator [Labedaea rhizosphaerae]|uniref:DNA-binding transcriptional LysR family regulator n=1 Tax=Labedaea rhizosphaerae TaxID=598644 RepID=A0A4R6S9P3_LABRH|nr:LysR family transcriptional regulator [Labedaea rhizosphaerae]TDP96183.1 DNA-binding transcriptional LysR family regulator [Labedaea rhizosphaerae]